MFPDHLEDCGLKESISLAMQHINGSLVHAVAERWNPRTNTFWFPWGEMTITLDEFSSIMGLPEPKGSFKTSKAPTITTLCYLKQRPDEKVRDFIQRWRSSCNKMRDSISQSHALGLIVNNLTQPLRSLISNALIKSFIDLTERAECIEAGIENEAFDAVIPVKFREDTKKNSRSQNVPANIVANVATFKKEKSEYPKNKGVMDRASGSSSDTKNKHPEWGYDRKFTPLQQSYEEVMHMLIERGHDTEDCLVLKNIVQDAVDKEIIKEDNDALKPWDAKAMKKWMSRKNSSQCLLSRAIP
ncbi:hypothetical protein EJ110_NYTH07253 [Nymphaea thermarum]|nr:hypothetical protein EJ110_NYTH07253 [Nymphaea thermarum]